MTVVYILLALSAVVITGMAVALAAVRVLFPRDRRPGYITRKGRR